MSLSNLVILGKFENGFWHKLMKRKKELPLKMWYTSKKLYCVLILICTDNSGNENELVFNWIFIY